MGRGTRSPVLRWAAALLAAVSACGAARAPASVAAAPGAATPDLFAMSLAELGDIEVTSVSRRRESLLEAAAAVFVISAGDIRRAGAITLPEALRLAPMLQVARVSASEYAISVRGFNNAIGNKLLVLVDGRTVYTPLFSGVFWDAQALPLHEVLRIEVVTGPGGPLWGLNAVNGVINVITREAAAGAAAGVLGGTDERVAWASAATALPGGGAIRLHARALDMDDGETVAGRAQTDGWRRRHAGFRADWLAGGHGTTLQGELYAARKAARSNAAGPRLEGTHVLARHSRPLAGGGSARVQAWYDRAVRKDPIAFQDRMEQVDIELQVAHAADRGVELTWGLNTRHARDRAQAGVLTTFRPGARNLHWSSAFGQAEVALSPSLKATAGARVETNVYTGAEFLPSVRLAWQPAPERLVWAALSRAVRAPARLDREFFFPGRPPFFIVGGPDFDSEVALVGELGVRARVAGAASVSLTAFHHDFDKLRSGNPPPARVENLIEGTVAGVEGWFTWRAGNALTLAGGVLAQHRDWRQKPGSRDPTGPSALGNDPELQAQFRLAATPTPAVELELALRHVGALPRPAVPAYTAVDASLHWRPWRGVTLSLVGRNLGDRAHLEFGEGANATVVRRQVMLGIAWQG